ncbi:DUF6531 domain-containing protein [Burkholderia sp. MSMB0856]|uniref:DUF6531 domain-containing protein n=1 Tax=Burkholderia sp. MSMB0856 TaxID=1637869 RepID=UPI0009E99F76|nr:DUF6531 domain-containing protein [Burkholderia sp. MSMB0856]
MSEKNYQNYLIGSWCTDRLLNLTVAFMLLLVTFGARADDCFTLYAKSGARPGSQTCELDVASNTPGGMGNYACINNLDLIRHWCHAGESDPTPENTCPVADPVFPGSGAVTLEATDFVSGDDWPMLFARTYNSKGITKSGGSMGAGWFHRWQRHLDLTNANGDNSSKVIAYRENGQPVTFNWSGGAWRVSGVPSLTLVQNSSGNWILKDLETESVESYSLQGILLSETTYSHATRTLTYDSSGLLTTLTQHEAATAAGQDVTLRFEYDSKRRLSRLTDPLGYVTQYGYDADDNLISVTWPDGYVYRYVYEDSRFKNAITGEINEIGTRVATWTYDTQGRAVTVSHPDSARDVQFTYNTGSTVIAGRTGATTLNMSSIGGVLRPTTSTSNVGNSSNEWDASGKLTKDTDASGGTREYSYDDIGRPIQVTFKNASAKSITTIRYADATSLRPSMIASPHLIQAFVYNPYFGNVMAISETPTTDATGASGFGALKAGGAATMAYGIEYGSVNRLQGVRETADGSETRRWRIIRDYTGNVYRIDQTIGNRSASTTMELRDAAHRVLRGKNPTGEFDLKYDSRGRITDFKFDEYANPANGNVRRVFKVSFSFSPDGRVTSRIGTVATNGSAIGVPISDEEINQWIDNYNYGDSPIWPLANLQSARQRMGSPSLPTSTVCSDCHFSAGGGAARGIAFIWKLVKNPAIKHGIGQGARKAKEAIARLKAKCRPAAEQIPGIPPGRAVKDITIGRSVRNVETDVGRAEFGANLTKDGWAHNLAKDGKTDIFAKNGERFTIRNDSNAGMPTAEYIPAGAKKATLKIRLPNP